MSQQLKIKLCREGARLPKYATSGAACFDLYAALDEPLYCCVGEPVTVPTGLKFDIPEGHVLMVFSRSGHGFKNDVRLANSVGIIDSDYTGELMVKLTQDADHFVEDVHEPFRVNNGDRIAQAMLMPVQQVKFEKTDVAPEQKGNRTGGFGSTGK